MKQTKKLISLLLAAVMILSILPITAWAVPELPTKPEPGKPGSTVIIACSDVQNPATSWLYLNGSQYGTYEPQAQLLTDIMSQIKKVYPKADGFICGGDYNYDYTFEGARYAVNGGGRYTAAEARKQTNLGISTVKNTVLDVFPKMSPDKMVFVQGNHDEVGSDYSASGAHNMGAYSVYVINEDDYMDKNTDPSVIQATGEALDTWLADLEKSGYKKPVFIVSHVPLHFTGRTAQNGDGMYASYIFEPIQDHADNLNIIFLYGHNHSGGDDDYMGGGAQFLTRGDSIAIAKEGSQEEYTQETLKFTYMNYGYVGYYWSNGAVNENVDHELTMTTFEINGNDVTIRRFDANGEHPLKSEGVVSYARKISDPVPPITKTYTAPVTVKGNGAVEVGEKAVPVTDEKTGITVKSNGTALKVAPKETVAAFDAAGITDYVAYDISVDDFTGEAEVTLPLPEGHNAVWHAHEGKVERVKGAKISSDKKTITFTTTSFSDFGTSAVLPVWILEADENHDSVAEAKGFTTLTEALRYIEADTQNVIVPSGGKIHIEVRADITETGYSASNQHSYAEFDLTAYSTLKEIEIYSEEDEQYIITSTLVSKTGIIPNTMTIDLMVEFSGEGTVWMHDFYFEKGLMVLAVNDNISLGKTTTKITDCTIGDTELVVNDATAAFRGTTDGHLYRVSDEYIVCNNRFEEHMNYAVEFTYGGDFSVIFNDNYITRFRALYVGYNATADELRKHSNINVTMLRNTLYHWIDYSTIDGISSCVALLQYGQYPNGTFDFEDNIMLGYFSQNGKVQAPGLMVQHTALGIDDGSEFIFKNNTLQCDVAEFAYKGQLGAYDTVGYTDELVAGEYKVTDDDATYTATVENTIKVHMYGEQGDPHEEEDLCHICSACGQMFLQFEIIDGEGEFEYLDGENWKSIMQNTVNIAHNLDRSLIAPDVELIDKVDDDHSFNGVPVDMGKDLEFRLRPLAAFELEKVELSGETTTSDEPVNITEDLTETDGSYYYTFTNNYHKETPYVACPKVTATFEYVPHCTIIHSSGAEKTVILLRDLLPTGILDVTAHVANGYLYGGLATDSTFAMPDDEYGKSLTPEDGDTYYLREVNEAYLQPAVISVRRKPGDTTVDHFLLTALDKDGADKEFYTWYGFAAYNTTNGTVGNILGTNNTVQPGASGEIDNSTTCCLYKRIELYNWGKHEATWRPNDVFFPIPEFAGANQTAVLPNPVGAAVTADDYFGCTSVNVSGNEFNFVPFYVTADGVLVTGTTVRTTNIGNQATQTWTESTDLPIASLTVKASEHLSSGSKTLKIANAMSTLPTSEESPISAQLLLAKPANMKPAMSKFAARRFVMVNDVAPASCTITTTPCRLSVLVYLR